jgi:hypothetical protein
LPSNFIVDGSRDTVTVRLKRPAKPRPAPASQDNPYGDAPSAEATSAPPTTTGYSATSSSSEAAPPSNASMPESTPAPSNPSAATAPQ